MQPQDFCCLPWCGASCGAPYKRAKIHGEWVEYPEGIDFHHTRGKKNPEGVYICHSCHMQHHAGTRKLSFQDELTERPSVRWVNGPAQEWQECRTATGLESA